MRKTKILAWTDDWGKSYSQEDKILKVVFRDELVDIFHIGSRLLRTLLSQKQSFQKDLQSEELFLQTEH